MKCANFYKRILMAMGLFAASPVFAGTEGLLTYGPANLSVPTLSGYMMILLALLLAVIAFRVIKQKSNGGTMAAALLSIGVLASSAGGIKLIDDAHATLIGGPLELPGGGTVIISDSQFNTFPNTSGTAQQILDIALPSSCGNFPDGGPFEVGPECAVGLVVQNGQSCAMNCRDLIIDM